MNQRDELFQEVFGGFSPRSKIICLLYYKKYLNLGLESKNVHNELTKRPLSKHEVEQTKGAQRPPVVAPRGRSRLRERPGGVAARRRSGPVFVSPSDENASDFSERLLEVAARLLFARIHVYSRAFWSFHYARFYFLNLSLSTFCKPLEANYLLS